jgi:cytochrome b
MNRSQDLDRGCPRPDRGLRLPPLTNTGGKVLVWDGVVRVFHWSLVAATATAATTGFLADASWMDVHVWAGVAAAALIVLRILWGFLGTTHARFCDFVAGPAPILRHVRGLLSGTAERHRGHNPLGGVMILAILLVITAVTLSGVVALGGVLKAGPLAFAISFATGWEAREVHEFLAFLVVGLAGVHVAGAIFESRRTGENLVRAMVDGRKEARETDHASASRRARPFLAAVIMAGLLVASTGAVWVFAAKPGLGVPLAALDPMYFEECSACHVAYHPSLLPRASWTGLMARLEEHFGENASLDAKTKAAISAYLQDNAAEAYDTKPANLFRRVAPETPFKIVATPFWTRAHIDIPDTVFASSSVGGRGNCEACHTDARTGRFSPGAIDISKEGP